MFSVFMSNSIVFILAHKISLFSAFICGIILYMKKLSDKDKQLLTSVVQRHAPWIKESIKRLRGAGKIGDQFEDNQFQNTGYNALVEALSSFDPSKGSFKTHAKGIIKHRILGEVEREMARNEGGGVDPYFLNQARQQRQQQAIKQPTAEPTAEPAVEPTTTSVPTEIPKKTTL